MQNANNSAIINQPIRLTEEQKKDLHSVLDEFFTCFDLRGMREILWDWLTAAMTSECSIYNTGYARSNLIFVYQKLELLIEATHQINRRRKKKKKRKHRKRVESGEID